MIYLLSSKYHIKDRIKDRIYIIGKAIDLKIRLSTCDKSCSHDVVYYKECNNEEEMDLIEKYIIKIK